MNIGYDAKRAFQNKTGLGNYIRSLIAILTDYYPDNKYGLFAPKLTSLFNPSDFKNVFVRTPQGFFDKKFPSLWRRRGMVKDFPGSGIDIFHGVSNELPTGIQHSGVKSVVTVHDVIFERYPETYSFDERYVHRWKVKHACKVADAVIAISKQTKDDLINFYKVPADKIFICYQSCNPIFQREVDIAEKLAVKKKYSLPDKYFLFVSSIAPRKNLVTICRAMIALKDTLAIPLVVIGNGKKEKEEVKKLMAENGIAERLILLNEMPESKEESFITAADFPAIYQQALALIYPSIFEGFGAPLLEALWSNIPVISSDASSLPEVGGDAALYFPPMDFNLLAKHMHEIATNESLISSLKEKGWRQARRFTTKAYAESVMNVYKHIL